MDTQSLRQLSLDEFLDRLASDSPTPGGGSVAALTGAQAAALGQMVAAFTVGKPKFAAVESQARAIAERLARTGGMLRVLINEDATAYGVLNSAFKLDKSDPRRAERVARAASLAGSVPLETAALSATALRDLEQLREIGNPLLRSDVEAAIHLARAAIGAAAANVQANLSLMDEESAQAMGTQLDALLGSPSA